MLRLECERKLELKVLFTSTDVCKPARLPKFCRVLSIAFQAYRSTLFPSRNLEIRRTLGLCIKVSSYVFRSQNHRNHRYQVSDGVHLKDKGQRINWEGPHISHICVRVVAHCGAKCGTVDDTPLWRIKMTST